jgi:hypothetical protein
MAGDLIMDVFNQDAFTALTLTEKVEKFPFQPTGIGELGLFMPDPLRTTALAIEERAGTLKLIPISQRGTEGTQRTTEQRKMRYFDVPRLMHDDTVLVSEIQGIRQFGESTVLMQLEEEVARRIAGPTGLQANVEYTKEAMRLAAVQGQMTDPATGSVMYNWFDEFEITPVAEVPFNLAAGTANSLRPIINGIVRSIARAAQGAPIRKVYAMCGDQFYDQFVNHPDVIRTYVNWSDARDIRNGSQGGAFGTFEFSDVVWFNYRGSDDNTTIKVPTDKVKFFPDAPGIFREAMAPGESAQWANQPGKPLYLLPIPDRDRQMWWKVEAYAYPLYICTRPATLQSGRAGA